MKSNRIYIYTAASILSAFVIWTLAVSLIDVQAIGPNGTSIGFATLNGYFHHLTGVNMLLYTLTDWLSLIPFLFIAVFATVGLIQLLRRKSFLKVDYSILILGGFYLVVMAAFVIFEIFVVNHRPILIDGVLEASYPSSTTVLITTVMPTAAIELNRRIKSTSIRATVISLITLFSIFMVVARLICGVHWLSDIIGGVLLSSALVMFYCYFCLIIKPSAE